MSPQHTRAMRLLNVAIIFVAGWVAATLLCASLGLLAVTGSGRR